MAYSGTVGQTVVTVQNLIDNGARRAGKLAEELTVEQVQSAKQSLFFCSEQSDQPRYPILCDQKAGIRPATEPIRILAARGWQ